MNMHEEKQTCEFCPVGQVTATKEIQYQSEVGQKYPPFHRAYAYNNCAKEVEEKMIPGSFSVIKEL